MLRNSSTHAEAAWYAIRIPLGWRKQSGFLRALARSSPILIVSLLSIASWATAQISLSRLWTDASDEFLVNSGLCGWVALAEDSTMANIQSFALYQAQRIESALAYVSLCHGEARGQTAQEDSCRRLPGADINYTMSDAPCPFADSSLCISTNSTPVTLDTGYLSSNTHFGVNQRQDESILYRKVANCSPVTTSYQDSPEEGVINFYYGPIISAFEGFFGFGNGIGDERTYTYRDRHLTPDELSRLAYTTE